ncbi:hypothetical protein BS47DRAFT_1364849 [Hydnum rufescens UP504]|uniref:Uncharacterized protein n=1 Tax=Hydnum rufescens UP504 TaxID=1448309 RepID=A0A9P6AQY7_9AGAM|nr:hypothetical protein BS47DRAFT_1364849 [Hydnum rufescens UP504]
MWRRSQSWDLWVWIGRRAGNSRIWMWFASTLAGLVEGGVRIYEAEVEKVGDLSTLEGDEDEVRSSDLNMAGLGSPAQTLHGLDIRLRTTSLSFSEPATCSNIHWLVRSPSKMRTVLVYGDEYPPLFLAMPGLQRPDSWVHLISLLIFIIRQQCLCVLPQSIVNFLC